MIAKLRPNREQSAAIQPSRRCSWSSCEDPMACNLSPFIRQNLMSNGIARRLLQVDDRRILVHKISTPAPFCPFAQLRCVQPPTTLGRDHHAPTSHILRRQSIQTPFPGMLGIEPTYFSSLYRPLVYAGSFGTTSPLATSA